MRRLLSLATSIVIAGSGAAFAQTGPMPGMGATSPLGTMTFTAPSGQVGIPLGSTELDPGGTSPLPGLAQCTGGAISGIGSAAASGVFDGDGTPTGFGIGTSNSGGSFEGGGTSLGTAIGSSCSTGAASGTLANTPAAGVQVPGSANGNTIPPGSVELANPGVSPLVGVPAPGITTSACGMTGSLSGSAC
jgi:hypothetical protein